MSSRHNPALSILVLALTLIAVNISYAGSEIYSGHFSMKDLVWQTAEDGTVHPELFGTRANPQFGLPMLPGKALNLLVPVDLNLADVRVIPISTRMIDAPGDLHMSGMVYNSENIGVELRTIPASDERYPAKWGTEFGVSYMQGFKILSLTVFPLQAVRDAAGRWTGLEFMEDYSVVIETGADILPFEPVQRERLIEGERERAEKFLKTICDNHEALSTYNRQDGALVPQTTLGFQPDMTPSLTGSAVRYLIITNDELADAFQPLADYRTASGMPSVVKTTQWIEANYRNGADIQETIRSFIRDAYQKWGVEYVLIGGDTSVVPVRYAFNAFYKPAVGTFIPTDLYYACLDGNWNNDGDDIFGETGTSVNDQGDSADMAKDVFIGRAPVTTPYEVGIFLGKIMDYEGLPVGSEHLDNMLLAAEGLFYYEDGTLQTDGAQFAEAIYTETLQAYAPWVDAVRMYEFYNDTITGGELKYPGAIPESKGAFIDSINSGHFNIVDQIGHGSFFNMSLATGSLTVADAAQLTNENDFLLYAVNCASGAFDYSCLLERYVLNPDGGSFASLGSSREAFPFSADDFQQEFFSQLFRYGVQELGCLFNYSAIPSLPSTFVSGLERWTLMNYTLLGDPGTHIWMDSPTTADVVMPSAIDLGEQIITVNVSTEGSPVEGAVVTLMMDGSLYLTDMTDASGDVHLTATVNKPGNIDVVVCGRNLERFEGDISANVPSVYVTLDSLQVIDDGTFATIGNGNGLMDAGETCVLKAYFHDEGSLGATNLTGLLTSMSSDVFIVSHYADIADLSPGGTTVSTEYFMVQPDLNARDGVDVTFSLEVSDGGSGVWQNEYTMAVYAPELEAVGLAWADTEFGNGDDIVDSGEQIVLSAAIKNFGVGTAETVTGYLRSDSPNVTIIDSVCVYPELGLMEAGYGDSDYSLQIVDVVEIYDLRIDFVDNFGRTVSHDIQLARPTAPVGMTTDSSLGPDVIALAWDVVDLETRRGYNVYRSLFPDTGYERANEDLIEDIAYFRDSDLANLTVYYYKITTVDQYLCESVMSTYVQQSTAPPELNNFPMPVETETSSHNAVGDVNGDGHPDIVLTAEEIYVWQADGSELFDGDNDAQTIGPITNYGGGFAPMTPALVDLDGIPGDEIIIGNWDDRTVHIYRHDGTELPGWPQITSTRVWMAPAVGDIDGDGELEIVINDLGAKTYAWNIDGTEVADGDGNPATNGVLIVRPEMPWEWGYSSPALFDVDNDGAAEIIFGTKYGFSFENFLHAFNADGSEATGFPYSTGYGSIVCSPAVCDLDGDDIWEVIFVAEHDSLHVVQQDGTRYEGFPISFVANSINAKVPCPSPAVGDFDNDGEFEIAAVAVYSGEDANIYVIDTDKAGGTSGDFLPGWPRHVDGNSESSPLVGDLNGDLRPDILFGIGGATHSPNMLYAFSHDGQDVPGFPMMLGGPVRPTPVICDLDEDHDVDIVYGGWDLKMHVWDLPHVYDGTAQPWGTFQGSNYRDGVHRRVSLTAVEEPDLPAHFSLLPVYPNPFNPTTTVKLYVPGTASSSVHLNVSIYDIMGRSVKTLHNGDVQTGWHSWNWDGRNVNGYRQASGVYFLRASSGQWSQVRKMSLLK
jgi:peptidase C25-like protein/flagellar hook capping protein FlgD